MEANTEVSNLSCHLEHVLIPPFKIKYSVCMCCFWWWYMLAQTYWNTNFLILTDSFDLNNKFPRDPTSKNRKYVIMFSEFQALRTCELFFVFALMAIGLQLNSGIEWVGDGGHGWRRRGSPKGTEGWETHVRIIGYRYQHYS